MVEFAIGVVVGLVVGIGVTVYAMGRKIDELHTRWLCEREDRMTLERRQRG